MTKSLNEVEASLIEAEVVASLEEQNRTHEVAPKAVGPTRLQAGALRQARMRVRRPRQRMSPIGYWTGSLRAGAWRRTANARPVPSPSYSSRGRP